MLGINNRGFKRSYVYGGTGIFDSIAKAAVSLLPAVQKGALQFGKKLGEKGVQKVSSFVYRSRDKPSKSEDNDESRFLQVKRTCKAMLRVLQYLLQNLRTYYENIQLLRKSIALGLEDLNRMLT